MSTPGPESRQDETTPFALAVSALKEAVSDGTEGDDIDRVVKCVRVLVDAGAAVHAAVDGRGARHPSCFISVFSGLRWSGRGAREARRKRCSALVLLRRRSGGR